MNSRLAERLQTRLEQIQAESRWKDYRVFASGPDQRIQTADARSLLLFTSNDYLGLARDDRVVEAARTATLRYGVGTASARFICGTTVVHTALERRLAELCATEDALTFNSGWSANLGLLATLPESGDLILSDALNHASLIDGARLAAKGVTRIVFPHADVGAVERELAAWRGPGIAYCVTDGVFSMEGTLAPLAELTAVARKYEAVMIVDDAHGIGVVGRTGRGCAEAAGVLGQVDIITGSLGKALGGVAGGFVAAPRSVTSLLQQSARAMLFTTALPAGAAAASCEALGILRSEPALVEELQHKVAAFIEALAANASASPRTIANSRSAIVPLVIGPSVAARNAAEELERNGIFVSCFSHPVVPEGQARLRFQISTAHGYEDLAVCADACGKALQAGKSS
jgi:glycine C-acetyltransferase